jgi:hypothetical protein
MGKQIKIEIIHLVFGQPKRVLAEIITKSEAVKGKLDIKSGFERTIKRAKHGIGKAFILKRRCADGLAFFK